MNFFQTLKGILHPRTLQGKLIVVLTASTLVMVITFGTLSLSIIANILEVQMGKRALSVSQSVSEIPEIIEALSNEDHSIDVQGIAERIRIKTDAEFIVVGDKFGRRYSHPDVSKIGKYMVGGDNAPALDNGLSYVSKAVGTLGPSIRGKVPVRNRKGEIVGVVSTGYLVAEVNTIIHTYQVTIKIMILFMIFLGLIASVFIAKSLKKAIFGLEPYEIAKLFQERNAILESIRSGLIAVNEKGEVTMVNQSALRILNATDANQILGYKLRESAPDKLAKEVLETGVANVDVEMEISGTRVIVNMFPIKHEDVKMGVVASFRKKDDVYRLAKELSKVKDYSDMLRAQTHEFSNKLHTISGLIQIEAYQEALELITKEASGYQKFFKLMNQVVSDPMISAIIIGKYNYAQEHDIEVEINHDSTMKDIPEWIDREKLVTILGNIFDNAFEAIYESTSDVKKVNLFMTDMGDELIFEIEDSGCGISPELAKDIFKKGFSTKSKSNRGYGLHIVNDIITQMNGTISISDGELGGALFTVAVPKDKGAKHG